jgi:uncharacterized membrane protein
MRTIIERPKRVYPILVILLVGFFALSAVGQSKGDDLSWIGNTGWALFMLTILATLMYSVVQLVRTMRRRRTSAA